MVDWGILRLRSKVWSLEDERDTKWGQVRDWALIVYQSSCIATEAGANGLKLDDLRAHVPTCRARVSCLQSES